jgi:hypothetical protein
MTHITKRRGANYKSTTNYALGKALLRFDPDEDRSFEATFNGVRYLVSKLSEGAKVEVRDVGDDDAHDSVWFDNIDLAYREAFLIAEWDFKVRGIVVEISKEDAQLIIETMAGDIADLLREIDRLHDAMNTQDEEDFRHAG